MGAPSSQLLHTAISILLALARDPGKSPPVQIWSLHALTMTAESSGPMFRGFVEPSLSTVIKLLLECTSVEVLTCLGRFLSALITTVGPELQGNNPNITMARTSFLCAAAVLQNHPDPVVRSQSIQALQQLHMFNPSSVDLSSLVPYLCHLLSSDQVWPLTQFVSVSFL